MDKRQQFSILDQWVSNSTQVSRSTKRLQEIDEWIDWEPFYELGRRIEKSGPKGGQPHKPVRRMIRRLFFQYLYRLSFQQFAGLLLDQTVPDFTTLWRFCEAMASDDLIEKLYEEITGQFVRQRTVAAAGNRF